mmetsp:Transcript_2495/g.9562  ORF Transcript_2495/g.9562 Transcript_2495/m.9562 type:complete len:221 (+) Transcript_2495:297-959(+)
MRRTTRSCGTKRPRRSARSEALMPSRCSSRTSRMTRPKSPKLADSPSTSCGGVKVDHPPRRRTQSSARSTPRRPRRPNLRTSTRSTASCSTQTPRSGTSTAPCSRCATSARATPSQRSPRPSPRRVARSRATCSATSSPSSSDSSPTRPPRPPSRPCCATRRCTPWSDTRRPRPSARSTPTSRRSGLKIGLKSFLKSGGLASSSWSLQASWRASKTLFRL